jgi:hypothetical protein
LDKKLIAAFTFGLLAVSAANLLLSIGIVSLLLTGGPETDVRLTDTGNMPGNWMETMSAVSLTDMNNTTTNVNPVKANLPAANVTITPLPSALQMPSTGLSTGGQFTPPSGQSPPAGELPQGGDWQAPSSGQLPSAAGPAPVSGQVPASSGQTTQAVPTPAGSGQTVSATQTPSDTGQLTSGIGQYMSGTGSMPVNGMSSTGIGSLPTGITSLINGQTGMASSATPTPKPELSFFNNMTNMIVNQQSGT